MPMTVWLALFFAIGVVGTWLARTYAVQRNLIDHPGERRTLFRGEWRN